MAAVQDPEEMEHEIKRWKLKKLIRQLDYARGNGTSMVTVMLTPKDQISIITAKLNQEAGTASNIKSHVNKLSVLSAITSVLAKLKLYNRTPPNGLVIYSGTVLTDDNKEKKVTIDMEPFKPVPRMMYYCDNKFHTEPLQEMLESDDRFGFVVVDGSGALYGTVCGNTRDIVHKLSVELPKKHGRGGQSAMRFARLRLEKRHNYLRKVAELATQFFITNDRPNVTGLVLAGSADFKNDLMLSDMFDPRLRTVVIKVVDVAYGGENGFNQAVEASSDALSRVRIVAEKQLLTKYFEEISRATNNIAYGIADTCKALDMGAVERLLCWEDLELIRFQVKTPGKEEVKYLTPKQAKDRKHYVDSETGATLEYESDLFVEWVTENYKKFGCTLEIVTDKSSEGAQFVRGFGGLGGFLRYPIDFMVLNEQESGNVHEPGVDSDFDEEDFM
jgi:peptide chain release factor subunit 1